MCVAPNHLADGTAVACHECWQCRNAKVDDWVGRCIAESRTSAATNAITLTYGRDKQVKSITYGEAEHERAIVLTYSDVQKWLKKLRFNGFPLRYFVTGEYGSRKGRSHWHVIVFWLDKAPEHKLDEMFAEKHWEHGHSMWTAPQYANFRYNTKYILKDMGEAERQGHLSMSKKPPLGAEYFARLARRYAQEGLAPQGDAEQAPEHGWDGWSLGRFQYTFPEAVRENGSRVIFHLRDTSERLFLQAYVDAWRELQGGKPMPSSKLVQEFLEPGSWKAVEGRNVVPLARETLRARKAEYQPVRSPKTDEDYQRLIAAIHRDTGRQLPQDEWVRLMQGQGVGFVEALGTYVYQRADGGRWLWRLMEGVPKWQRSEPLELPVSERRVAGPRYTRRS